MKFYILLPFVVVAIVGAAMLIAKLLEGLSLLGWIVIVIILGIGLLALSVFLSDE